MNRQLFSFFFVHAILVPELVKSRIFSKLTQSYSKLFLLHCFPIEDFLSYTTDGDFIWSLT